MLLEFFSMYDRDKILAQDFQLKSSEFKGVFVRPETDFSVDDKSEDIQLKGTSVTGSGSQE